MSIHSLSTFVDELTMKNGLIPAQSLLIAQSLNLPLTCRTVRFRIYRRRRRAGVPSLVLDKS